MGYFRVNDRYLGGAGASGKDAAAGAAPAPTPEPARPACPAPHGGYFRADAHYRPQAEGAAVEAPWGVAVQEAGEPGRVRVTWRLPYTPCDSCGVYGLAGGGTPPTWQELGRVASPAVEAVVVVPPGAWQIAMRARRGSSDSPLSPAVPWYGLPGTPTARGGVAAPILAPPEERPAPPEVPAETPPAPMASPGPVCPRPGCGARIAAGPDGQPACVYCGGPVAITPDGLALAVETLLYGACRCCRPRRPLIRQGEQLICPARPERRYGVPLPYDDGRRAEGTAPAPPGPANGAVPEPVPEWDWTTIDNALRANSARLGRNGLFVRAQPADHDDR